jgi:hypothetical protein
VSARELLDRWIEALQILAGDDDNPGAEGRERMRADRAQFLARYDAERRAEALNEAAAEVDVEREATDVNVAVYPRYDAGQKRALSRASALLRAMATNTTQET